MAAAETMSAVPKGSKMNYHGNDVKTPEKITQAVISDDPHMLHFTGFMSAEEIEHILGLAEGNWVRSTVTRGSASTLLTQKETFKHERSEDVAADVTAVQEPKVDTQRSASASGTIPDQETKLASTDVTNEMTKEEIDSFAQNTGKVKEVFSDRCTSYTYRLPFNDIVVERILARVATVTALPLENIEPLVMVRYTAGQVFKLHHDGAHRPKTVFMYLNDVASGGETYFPHLGFKIRPKKGTAVMWPNNMVDDETGEHVADRRMDHEALPPEGDGMKIGMNCFVNIKRQRDAAHIKIVQNGGA